MFLGTSVGAIIAVGSTWTIFTATGFAIAAAGGGGGAAAGGGGGATRNDVSFAPSICSVKISGTTIRTSTRTTWTIAETTTVLPFFVLIFPADSTNESSNMLLPP
jgi:hypothetical protein